MTHWVTIPEIPKVTRVLTTTMRTMASQLALIWSQQSIRFTTGATNNMGRQEVRK